MDQAKLNALNFTISNLAMNPLFARYIDPAKLLQAWSELNGWYTPDWIRNPTNMDAERVAKLENIAMVYGNMYDEPKAGEDHNTHSREHKQFLAQFATLQNGESQYPGLRLLKQHDQMTDILMQQEATMMQAQQSAMQPLMTPGMAAGNAQAGPMGAMTGTPFNAARAA